MRPNPAYIGNRAVVHTFRAGPASGEQRVSDQGGLDGRMCHRAGAGADES